MFAHHRKQEDGSSRLFINTIDELQLEKELYIFIRSMFAHHCRLRKPEVEVGSVSFNAIDLNYDSGKGVHTYVSQYMYLY